MVKRRILIGLFFLLFGQMIAYGAGKAEPFTKKILNNFTFDEIKHAQFYLNNTLILTRVIPYGETKGVDEGTLSIRNGEKVETIQISDKVGGELMSLNNNILGICFSAYSEDRILYFSEELIGTEYFLNASSSKVKYGQYEYKVNKKPKLLVQFNEQFIREKTIEKEEGRKVQ
jgi:hypothetical protein